MPGQCLIIPDSFKGSLTSVEVCRTIEDGCSRVLPSMNRKSIPLADGGEGSLEVLNNSMSLTLIEEEVLSADGRMLKAHWGLYENEAGQTMAFVESAQCLGIHQVAQENLHPFLTSSFGLGQLLNKIITKGVKQIVVSLGGSGCHDFGIGMLEALGFCFLDKNRNPLAANAENLGLIEYIGRKESPRLQFEEISMTVLCDVDAKISGVDNCCQLYAPQKGADQETLRQLEKSFCHFAGVLKKSICLCAHQYSWQANFKGSGAAGGLAAALSWCFSAKVCNGADWFIQQLGIEEYIQRADWVISGEGRLDAGSFKGKLVGKIVELADRWNKPCALFVGQSIYDNRDLKQYGNVMVYACQRQSSKPLHSPLTKDAAVSGLKQSVEDNLMRWVEKLD